MKPRLYASLFKFQNKVSSLGPSISWHFASPGRAARGPTAGVRGPR